MKKQQLVWIILFVPIIMMLLLLWLTPEFIEKNWLVPLSLMMISFVFFLKLSGGYKGISTVIAIVVTSFTFFASLRLYPAGKISGGADLLLWIVTYVVIWRDRGRLPKQLK